VCNQTWALTSKETFEVLHMYSALQVSKLLFLYVKCAYQDRQHTAMKNLWHRSVNVSKLGLEARLPVVCHYTFAYVCFCGYCNTRGLTESRALWNGLLASLNLWRGTMICWSRLLQHHPRKKATRSWQLDIIVLGLRTLEGGVIRMVITPNRLQY
jgi:hypothetical protein